MCAGGAAVGDRAGSISSKSAVSGRRRSELWTAVGKASGREQTEEPFKSRKCFGYRVRQARARARNTSVRDLLSNDRYTEAGLNFLRGTKVGEVRAGVICR